MFHELEPAYVLGDFALKPADKGFVIVPARPDPGQSASEAADLPAARVGTSKVIRSTAQAFPTGSAST